LNASLLSKIINMPHTVANRPRLKQATRMTPMAAHRLQYSVHESVLPEVNQLGWDHFRVASQGELHEHIHKDAYEFCYLVSGSVDWWVEDSIYEVRPGEVFVTRPGERHGGVDAVMHQCELYWIQVNLDAMSRFAGISLAREIERMSIRPFAGSPVVNDRFKELLNEQKLRTPLSVTAARAALHSLLVTIVRDHAVHRASLDARSAGTSVEVRRALDWLEKHLNSDFAVEELATIAGLRSSRFYERFLQEVGFTPAEYRSRMRITQAKRLLRAGKKGVTDIALDLGFSTSQYFATVFKNRTGLTPREYQLKSGNA